MGLDLVELIEATETAFGISIPDADAATIRNGRQLAAYVRSRVAVRNGPDEVLQRAFYVLRDELATRLAVAPRTIRPESDWATLLPLGARRAHWRALGDPYGERAWPTLWRPLWLRIALTALFGAGLWWGASLAAGAEAVILAPVLGVGLVSAAYHLTGRLARELPPGIRTVGDSARKLATFAPSRFLRTGEDLSLPLVEATVLAIVREELGAPEAGLDDDFIIDLGAS